ncbi:MAG: CoB--CoM heterodisulfide reductase iron-sulfur subunit A family protein [Euryarchaeota archaeon]|nr:CoB--CoM heterodisulfide reductase iron-sulfur subunit A family protein [Euryarchaeota archaeon]MDE1880025.1 CoB--CoM heterodisulfide reductase iron-sulfur subunit A family protein [Euryarchaeota archaeon]
MSEDPSQEVPAPKERRVGVFLCQCGGNISDYVDTEKARATLEKDPGVAHIEVQMFACSDAGQQCIVRAIQEKKLDGLVVASCSPKLHTMTFRGAARRGGLNPYEYTQANVREQDSWAHTHDRQGATDKAVAITRAAIARTVRSRPLEPIRTDTAPSALVVGAGVSGLRSALALSDLGISVHLVERAEKPGGQLTRWARLFPNDKSGRAIVDSLLSELGRRDNIVLYTRAEVVEKEGHIGDFTVKVRTSNGEKVTLKVGAIVVATGFEPYTPPKGEFGYGEDGVLTLPEFEELLGDGSRPIEFHGRPVRTITYVYCVGSRNPEGYTYCSRYCCSATSYAAIRAAGRDPHVRQYHLFRDIRTYGKYESLYERALKSGSLFLRYKDDSPPTVTREGGGLLVKVADQLTGGEGVEIPTDLVVLVTGMVPRENTVLTDVLKLPVGKEGFYNEIHQKLRPVETVVDGVFLAGTAQGPKNTAESVASALAAVSKTAGILLKGYVDLDPLVAKIDTSACTWCGLCAQACPYGAIEEVAEGDKRVAKVVPVLCKGEGACVPVCPLQAIEVEGYTHDQMRSMIEALASEEE